MDEQMDRNMNGETGEINQAGELEQGNEDGVEEMGERPW